MSVSIIIPARNEAARIGAQIAHLQSLAQNENTRVEIIVCDGQSDDATASIAWASGATVVQTAPNRGLQQNAGAKLSSGDILWFLHADEKPHAGSFNYLKHAHHRNAPGGNFQLHFDRSTPATRAMALIARLQRQRGVYYGDSGIWVRRDVFEAMKGFRDWPLFEDYDFARRLEAFARRHGMRTEYSRVPITVSARRLEKQPGKVLAQWLLLQCLFSIGVSPEKLTRYYHPK